MSVSKWLVGLVGCVALSLGLTGCGGGDGGDAGGNGGLGGSDVYLTCKVNGQSVRIEGLGCVIANYQQHEDETVVQTGGPQEYRFLFVIPGKTTGNWSLGDEYTSITVTTMDDFAVYSGSQDYEDQGAAAQLAVTAYGSVGSYVNGTFSGTCINISDGSIMTVTEGKFHASRIADVTD